MRKTILAGICISLGGAAYLKVGGLPGAVLFAFGLLTIMHYGLYLYTGMAGHVDSIDDVTSLFIVLLGNVLGCLPIALMLPESFDGADIIFQRIEAGYVRCLFGSMLCGIIMTLVVDAARRMDVLPLIWGIPLFIVCGFYHSIADAFYMFASLRDYMLVVDYLPYWCVIVLGNFIGCSTPRFFNYIDKDK